MTLTLLLKNIVSMCYGYKFSIDISRSSKIEIGLLCLGVCSIFETGAHDRRI